MPFNSRLEVVSGIHNHGRQSTANQSSRWHRDYDVVLILSVVGLFAGYRKVGATTFKILTDRHYVSSGKEA